MPENPKNIDSSQDLSVSDAPASTDIQRVHDFLHQLQRRICESLEAQEQEDGGTAVFVPDDWQREEGGGGRSCVLQGGKVIEKAGVMFSHIRITHLPASATTRHPEIAGCPAEAIGLSLVIHPKNPHVPTSHANVRLFVAHRDNQPPIWWMGGGMDLTPFYPNMPDCVHWHQVCHDLCAPFGDEVYPKYKAWCDEYFYIRHRDEQRGIGGLFYDDLNEWGFERCFEFMRAVGQGYLDGILPIFKRNQHLPYTSEQRDFQLYRRGRYVEFNLVYDRGTLFGLQTSGRIESILVSLPNLVSWQYCPQFKYDSAEAQLTDFYLKPQDWLTVK